MLVELVTITVYTFFSYFATYLKKCYMGILLWAVVLSRKRGGGGGGGGVRVTVLNATFNNISIISWRSVLLVKETGVPRENQQPVASH